MRRHCLNRALDLHNKVVRTLLEQHRGYEQGTEGDSFLLCVSVALHGRLCTLQP